MAARKSATKNVPAKKAAVAKKAPVKKAPAKTSAAKKAPVKKATAKKAAVAKKTPVKKAPVKKAPAKTSAAKKAPVKKAPAKKAPAKKVQASKAAAKKAPAKKVPVGKAAAKNAPTAVEPTEVFSPRFLEQQRRALLEQRATYERQSRSLRDEAASLVEDFQSGDVQFDEESGEGDTLNVAREQDLMMSSQALSAIADIDHALAKFDIGTYGICEVSGKSIPKARLEAIPWARERVEYKVGGLTSR